MGLSLVLLIHPVLPPVTLLLWNCLRLSPGEAPEGYPWGVEEGGGEEASQHVGGGGLRDPEAINGDRRVSLLSPVIFICTSFSLLITEIDPKCPVIGVLDITCSYKLLVVIGQSPGLSGWRKVNLITMTRRPHHPSISADLYCQTTSPGFLSAFCKKWNGFFYVHRVFLSYTWDRWLWNKLF